MPEQNFEQQARDMANGFEIKPRAEVWQNVRNAIQEPKRKRKIALWWWLLPLGLISGIAFYTFTKSDALNKTAINKAARQTTTNSQANLSAQEQPEKQGNSNNNDTSAVVRSSIKTPLHQQLLEDAITDDKTAKKITELALKNAAISSNKSIVLSEVNSNKTNINDRVSINASINSQQQSADSLIAVQNGSPMQLKDSIRALPLVTDTSKPLNAITATLSTLTKADSIINNKSSVSKEIDSFNLVKSPVISQKDSADVGKSTASINKKFKSKIQWGLLAEAAVAERRSPVFPFAGTDKSSSVPISSPNANGSGSFGGSTGRNGFYFNNNIRQGAALGAGIALQKPLSRSIAVFADVAYYYQTFHVATTAYKDSLVLNNYLTSLAGSYKAKQAFHFASFFAGINWHFVNVKHLQLGISTGVDNLLLLSAKQRISGISGTNFSLADALETSDSAFAKNSFYNYQPGLFAGLLVNMQLSKQQLQLQPFARNSFRPFEKNSTSNNNHLFSAGLRAVYFFK